MNRLIKGAIAGLTATAPMTVIMSVLDKLPTPSPERLPPEEITTNIAHRAGVTNKVGRQPVKAAAWPAHFAYGAASGSLYSLTLDRATLPPLLKGPLFGLAVWGLSYLGWLPATGILPPATQHSARRNLTMITAHLVWGAGTSVMQRRVLKEP